MSKQFLVLYVPEDDYAGVPPLPGELYRPHCESLELSFAKDSCSASALSSKWTTTLA